MTHQVFFWLIKELTDDQRAFFVDELKLLPKLSYVRAGSVGKPAATCDRAVVDHSYDFCLILDFPTLEDHEFYQTECPVHRRFVESCAPYFEKVVIFDSETL